MARGWTCALHPESSEVFNVLGTACMGTGVCFPQLVFNVCISDLGLAAGLKDGQAAGGRSH